MEGLVLGEIEGLVLGLSDGEDDGLAVGISQCLWKQNKDPWHSKL